MPDNGHGAQFISRWLSGTVDPESILGQVTPKTLKEEFVTYSLGLQHGGEVQRLVELYQYNVSG